MKALLRGSLATLVGSVTLFVASTALADGEPCINDDDCPGTECGTAVCNWNKPQAGGMFTCNPAGTDPPVGGKQKDGWCTTTDDCKCKSLGATCTGPAPYCTFTKPPAGTAGTSAGGSASTAGTTSTAGTATAGTAAGGTGPTTPAPAADSGGCSLSVPGGTNTALALGVGLLGLGVAFARRRR